MLVGARPMIPFLLGEELGKVKVICRADVPPDEVYAVNWLGDRSIIGREPGASMVGK